MTTRLYVPAAPMHMVGPQMVSVTGQNADGSWFWFGDHQQTIWGLRDDTDPQRYARVSTELIGDKIAWRMPFNYNSFVYEGGEWKLPADYELLLAELANLGVPLIFDLHDGPGHKPWDEAQWVKWPQLYRPIRTFKDFQDIAAPLIRTRQREGWTRFFQWLGNRPNIHAVTIAYEYVNEAAAQKDGIEKRNCPRDWMVEDWMQNLEAINEIVATNDPTRARMVPVWGYQGDVAYLAYQMPTRGGQRMVDGLREMVPDDWRVWAVHWYVGYDKNAQDQRAHDRIIQREFGILGNDPVAITERNINGTVHDPLRRGVQQKHHFAGRHYKWQMLGAPEGTPYRPIGIAQWPAYSYAGSGLARHSANDRMELAYRHSLAQALSNWHYRNPVMFDTASSGYKEWKILETGFNGMLPDNYEIDGWKIDKNLPKREYAKDHDWAYSQGGAGTTVHICPDGEVTCHVEGGDGKTVIHSHANVTYQHNNFTLGRMGGVVRLGAGSHFVNVQGGPARIHTAPQGYATLSVPYSYGHQIIVDPDSTLVHLYGWRPLRGDKISFKGAFADPATLREALELVRNTAQFPNNDLHVHLPGGGLLIIMDGGDYGSRLYLSVLEFEPDYVEPLPADDFDEDEFTNPLPPQEEIEEEPLSDSPFVDPAGNAVLLVTPTGNAIEFA